MGYRARPPKPVLRFAMILYYILKVYRAMLEGAATLAKSSKNVKSDSLMISTVL